MEGILNRNLDIIPNLTKSLKEMISYFWQPSMERRDSYQPRRQQPNYQKPPKQIDKRKQLSLDSIMMLHLFPSDTYRVTMYGLKQSNCDHRVLLSNGLKEKDVIEQCLESNIPLERKPIAEYMPSDYVEIYNEALRIGNYECCLTMLRGIESHINALSKERKELVKTRNQSYQ